MAVSYATTDDVATEVGRPASSAEEEAQWQAWLDRVERAIARGFRRSGLVLADQVTAGDPTEDDVRDVEVAAVARKVRGQSLDGLTSETVALDDGSVTRRREDGASGDPLELTDAEWMSLLPTAEVGAFSTRPGFDADTAMWPADTGARLDSAGWS